MAEESREGPHIYVACIASYNNGRLHGEWIDALDDVEDIREKIAGILASSSEPHPVEFAIHDSEGFETIELSEFERLQQVHDLANLVNDFGELGAETFSHASNVAETRRLLTECYAGGFSSMADFAFDHASDAGLLKNVPPVLAKCIDYEQLAEDMLMVGDIFVIQAGGKSHVFWEG